MRRGFSVARESGGIDVDGAKQVGMPGRRQGDVVDIGVVATHVTQSASRIPGLRRRVVVVNSARRRCCADATRYRLANGETICHSPRRWQFGPKIAADLRPSADRPAFRTSLVAAAG